VRPADYIDRAAEHYGARVALIDGSTRFTYTDLQQQSVRIAGALRRSGVNVGDRVAAYSGNAPKLILALCGVMRAGGVWAPLNPGRVSEADNLSYLQLIEPTLLFYQRRYETLVSAWRGQLPSLRRCVCIDDDHAGDGSFTEWLVHDQPGDVDWGNARGNPDALVGIFQTGGTTGTPKAVMWDVMTFAQGVEASRAALDYDDRAPVSLNTLPLAHGGIIFLSTMLTLGATQYVTSFSVEDVLHRLAHDGITHLLLAPSGVSALLASPAVVPGGYPALRCLRVSTAAITAERLQRAVDVFGPCLSIAYGQMETLLVSSLHKDVVAAAARGIEPKRLHSCGKVVDSMMVRFADAEGRLLPPHSEGEIVVRGRGVSPGYFNDPAATAHARRGGWHHTGDVGYLDEHGFLYVTGRLRDIIISGGYNIYAAEVEAAIMAIGDVRECAAVGVADDTFGEVVAAVVVWGGRDVPAPSEIVAHCLTRLNPMALPRRVEFWPELPRTPAGKIDKMAIRRTLAR
jgi:fatty-acyl-CoA synthase